jgi:hypothetical protein
MKKLIFEKLKQMVEDGKLQFGFYKEIKEFTLESYNEKDENTIVCTCVYIEDGKVFQKYVELAV